MSSDAFEPCPSLDGLNPGGFTRIRRAIIWMREPREPKHSCATCEAVACPDSDICPDCLLRVYQETGADVETLEPPLEEFDVQS